MGLNYTETKQTNFSDWKTDKGWSDVFLPEIKSILGVYLLSEPPIEEDAERNTDLMVLKMDSVRIGCRVRKYSYLQRYPNEFTIRKTRPSGNKSELAKIIEGWGTHFFYGFSDEYEMSLAAWILCDLNVFRLWLSRKLIEGKGTLPGYHKSNADNSSSFISFKINELPDEFIIARKVA